MPRADKVEAVQVLKDRLESSNAALLTEFRGLRVSEMAELRRSLGETGTELKVVKNTLGRLAAKQANLNELLPLLEGSTAIAFIAGDPVSAAKGIDAISKKYPALVIKGGLLEGKVLSADRARALATVKPREVLLAQLAGLAQSQIQQLAFLLSAPLRQLGYALTALQQKLPAEPPQAAASAAEAGSPSETADAAPADSGAAQPAAGPETTAPESEAAGQSVDQAALQAEASGPVAQQAQAEAPGPESIEAAPQQPETQQ